jgi:hypothetical protein
MSQRIFAGDQYGFVWVGDWYVWDYTAGNKAALQARNQEAKQARLAGRKVRLFSLGESLTSHGGIGSGHPHIELWCKVYGLNIY